MRTTRSVLRWGHVGGDAFVERDIDGILAMMTDDLVFEACDILSMRDGKIAAKRSYRKGRA